MGRYMKYRESIISTAALLAFICLIIIAGCATVRPGTGGGIGVTEAYNVKFYSNGMQVWFMGDKIHRVNDPAIIHPNGHKEWWFNGKRHRHDGPAVITSTGTEEYWFNGILYTDMERWSNAVVGTKSAQDSLHGQTIILNNRTYILHLVE